MIGFRTIRQGERVAVWDTRGRVRLVDGPRRLWLFRQSVQPLARPSATADQYLAVRFQDGHVAHVPGPASVWFDPVQHQAIAVQEALHLDGNEALVVYRRAPDGVTRRVVRGPALFVPSEDEWLHPFCWHGADPRNPRRKVPGALTFTRLRVIPDQMYFDVDEVRTADDALLVVKLMVFFELEDIQRMLDQTHDPIADFINALSADVIDFVAGRDFGRFKDETDRLNDLATYANLTGRAERIGYRVTKVVYRGYHATDKLQAMHDGAIEARTELHLQAETEAQAQELADLKLRREAQRATERQQMEVTQAEHAARLQRLAHDEKLRQGAANEARRRQDRQQMGEVVLAQRQAANQLRLDLWRTMQGLQVDLTRYLVAQYQHPDRLIRIDGGPDRPQLHLHP